MTGADAPGPTAATATRGEMLARAHCSTCHLFPAPTLLDRKTWLEQTLPRMKMRMGLDPEMLARQKDSEILRQTAGFLKAPPITEADFALIVGFFQTKAPAEPLPQDPHPEIAIDLPLFQYERIPTRATNPATTLVRIVESEKRLYFGDANARHLWVLGQRGEPLGDWALASSPVAMIPRAEGLYMASIGSFLPSDQRLARIDLWQRGEVVGTSSKPVLEQLFRTTDFAMADLNGDGREDLVVCQYGNNAGHFSWFEATADHRYTEHVLTNKTGAIRAVVRDFNGDSKPDIAVLFAQETEALMLFQNRGGGRFEARTVFQRPPVFGHTGFEVTDFDGDGRLDFLVTNGDNGEYASPTKKYHGVRLYLDRGTTFEHMFLFPINGAFRAIARDFDQDGDLDIAVISFYPDYTESPQESFVYLENLGGFRFQPRTFRECISGRWIVMDAGDLDGDGDVDLVLGSCIHGPTEVPGFLMQDWESVGPSVVILRNKLK